MGRDPGEQCPAPARRGTGRAPARPPTGAPAARTGPAPAGAAAGGRPAGGSPGRASRHRGRAARTAAARLVRRRRRGPPPVADTDRSSTAARPPSSGWATGASGWTSSTPRAARSIEAKNGERERQRQDRRADVVAEPGQRQLRGPGPATGRRGGLVDADRAPGTGQGDGRGQAVRSGPDDDRVDAGRSRVAPRPLSDPAGPHPRRVSLRTGAVRVRRADRIVALLRRLRQ